MMPLSVPGLGCLQLRYFCRITNVIQNRIIKMLIDISLEAADFTFHILKFIIEYYLVHWEWSTRSRWLEVGLGVVQDDVGGLHNILTSVEELVVQQHATEHSRVHLHPMYRRHVLHTKYLERITQGLKI